MARTPGDDGLARELREANERLVLAGLRQQELTEEARRARAQLEALLDNMTEGVTVFGSDGEVVLTNPCDRSLHGLPTDRPATSDDFRRCDVRGTDGEPLDFDRHLLAPLLRGERLSEMEVVLVLRDGGRRDLLVSGSAVFEDGVTLAIKTARDVTEVRELERMRERTMAAISHDLRGPLSAAKMAAQYLAEAPTDDPRRHDVFWLGSRATSSPSWRRCTGTASSSWRPIRSSAYGAPKSCGARCGTWRRTRSSTALGAGR